VETPPPLTVSRVACRPVGGAVQHPGDAVRWTAAWLLHNAGAQPLELEAAWIPHGRFRGDGRLPLAVVIDPGASHELEFAVTAEEPPGTIVENAFLILRVRVSGAAWRVFVRMRIEFDPAAVPVPVVETITTQSLK
jgi:hypothetical protein